MGCTAAACRAEFSFCSDDGAHSDGARAEAKFGTGENDTAGVAFVHAGAVYVPSTNVAPQLDATGAVCAAISALSAGDWCDPHAPSHSIFLWRSSSTSPFL